MKIRIPKRALPWFGLASALAGPACSGDDTAPPAAGAGAADAGIGGDSAASSGGAGGSSAGGGRGDTGTDTGSSGASGAAAGGASGGGSGGVTGTGGALTDSGAGGSFSEGGPADGGNDVTVDAGGEAETAPCLAPRVACPSACADLSTDPNHCGTCAHACAALEACTNGTCTAAHCGSALKFTIESEQVLATSGDGGVGSDGGTATASPNRVLLARGAGRALDAWITASDGVYQAIGGGTGELLLAPRRVVVGASQSVALTYFVSDAGVLSGLLDDTLNDVALLVGTAQAGFSTAGTIPIGDHEGSVLAVDIDGDGEHEIVVGALSFPGGPITLSIYKVPPLDQPTLWRSRLVPLGGSLDAYGLAAGNFDHDGYRDIAFAVYGSGSPALVTFHNTPSDLSDPVVHVLSGGRVRSPLVFDFDQDGFDDVVAVAGPSIHFFKGSGTGLATDPVTTTPVQSYVYADAAAGDLDGDGKVDLALVRRVPPSGTQVVPAWGDGHGKFGLDFTQALALPSVSGIAAGDVDGDGRTDLVVVSADRGSMTAVRNGCY